MCKRRTRCRITTYVARTPLETPGDTIATKAQRPFLAANIVVTGRGSSLPQRGARCSTAPRPGLGPAIPRRRLERRRIQQMADARRGRPRMRVHFHPGRGPYGQRPTRDRGDAASCNPATCSPCGVDARRTESLRVLTARRTRLTRVCERGWLVLQLARSRRLLRATIRDRCLKVAHRRPWPSPMRRPGPLVCDTVPPIRCGTQYQVPTTHVITKET